MGQLFVWLALLFLVLYSMSSDCSVILSLSLFLRLWFQRFLLTYEGGLFYVFTNYTTFKLQRVGRLKFNRFLSLIPTRQQIKKPDSWQRRTEHEMYMILES